MPVLRRYSLIFLLILMSPGLCMAQKRIHTVFFENTDHELNVFRIYGQEPGKTLMLIGGIQGDEPGGFLSADLYADFSLQKGNLIVVPRANFQSIVLKRRKINEDMNRKFAEDRQANYETKIVGILKQLIAESDGLLNLHDGSGFFREKWIDDMHNPMRFGQSIIADCETYHHAETGMKLELGKLARRVCERINHEIKNPAHHFHFNNHHTSDTDSKHKEQRKSATYYALQVCHIPAFGIETSKSLPLEDKVRHHNLAINGFMEEFGIIPETPGIYLEPPELRYAIVSINNTAPVVVRDNQTLHLAKSDTILISHIEANYERGLSADIIGFGAVNDMRKAIAITKATRIVIRKDYYPCGKIYLDMDAPGAALAKPAVISGGDEAQSPSFLFFKVKINEVERVFENMSEVELVKGDIIELVDVMGNAADPSQLVVNFKGFVGDRKNNTGEDRGYVIDTARDLWERYAIDNSGTLFQTVVQIDDRILGKLFFRLKKPVLKYIVVQMADETDPLRCLRPGAQLQVNGAKHMRIVDINTNVTPKEDIQAFLAGPDDYRQMLTLDADIAMDSLRTTCAASDNCQYQIRIERNRTVLGSVALNL